MRTLQPFAYLIAAALVVNAWHSAANAVPPNAVQANSNSGIQAAVTALNPQLKVTSIKDSAIPGVKEVIVGSDVLYFSNDGKHLIQGTMFETSSKRNLTDDALAGVRLNALKGVVAKDMIVFPAKGKTLYSIKVVSDIDCGVCRKLHADIAQFSEAGIEVQYLIMPRNGLTDDSARKSVAVYCAANPQKALTEAKSGTDPGNASCPNPVARNVALAAALGIQATPTLVFSDGGVAPGYLPVPALLAELDRRAALAVKRPL
jgi:thiol:disulfide interchange protein DsbC